MSVDKATNRRLRSAAAQSRADRHPDARLRSGSSDPASFPRSRSAGFRFARSHDGNYGGWCVGGPHEPRCMDTGKSSACDHDVGASCDADTVPQAEACSIAAPRLLRRQCLRAAEGADSPCVQRRLPAPANRSAESPDRCDTRSASRCQPGASAASTPGRSKSDSRRRAVAGRSLQPQAAATTLARKRRQQEDGRKAFSGFHGDDLRQVAAAIAPHAGHAPPGRRSEGDARRARSGLQHAQRIDCRFSKGARDYADAILHDFSRRLNFFTIRLNTIRHQTSRHDLSLQSSPFQSSRARYVLF